MVMSEEREPGQRLAAYPDAVFAVIVTIMVLELEAPRLGFGLICGALVLHLRPEVPARA
jgi:uncharacterized membrane protein